MKKRLFTLILCILLLVPSLCLAQQTVERVYHWYAEEKITVSNTVKTLTAAEYGYAYGPTRIEGFINTDPNADAWTAGEVLSDGTTGAMGLYVSSDQDPNDLDSMSYIDIQILYTGLDNAGFDPNDVLTGGTSGQTAQLDPNHVGYTRGKRITTIAGTIYPLIAEVHLLDNSIIWTDTRTTPVYSATDSLCFGRKQYEGDTFYIFGTKAIEEFKAIRSSGTDAIIAIRYGR